MGARPRGGGGPYHRPVRDTHHPYQTHHRRHSSSLGSHPLPPFPPPSTEHSPESSGSLASSPSTSPCPSPLPFHFPPPPPSRPDIAAEQPASDTGSSHAPTLSSYSMHRKTDTVWTIDTDRFRGDVEDNADALSEQEEGDSIDVVHPSWATKSKRFLESDLDEESGRREDVSGYESRGGKTFTGASYLNAPPTVYIRPRPTRAYTSISWFLPTTKEKRLGRFISVVVFFIVAAFLVNLLLVCINLYVAMQSSEMVFKDLYLPDMCDATGHLPISYEVDITAPTFLPINFDFVDLRLHAQQALQTNDEIMHIRVENFTMAPFGVSNLVKQRNVLKLSTQHRLPGLDTPLAVNITVRVKLDLRAIWIPTSFTFPARTVSIEVPRSKEPLKYDVVRVHVPSSQPDVLAPNVSLHMASPFPPYLRMDLAPFHFSMKRQRPLLSSGGPKMREDHLMSIMMGAFKFRTPLHEDYDKDALIHVQSVLTPISLVSLERMLTRAQQESKAAPNTPVIETFVFRGSSIRSCFLGNWLEASGFVMPYPMLDAMHAVHKMAHAAAVGEEAIEEEEPVTPANARDTMADKLYAMRWAARQVNRTDRADDAASNTDQDPSSVVPPEAMAQNPFPILKLHLDDFTGLEDAQLDRSPKVIRMKVSMRSDYFGSLMPDLAPRRGPFKLLGRLPPITLVVKVGMNTDRWNVGLLSITQSAPLDPDTVGVASDITYLSFDVTLTLESLDVLIALLYRVLLDDQNFGSYCQGLVSVALGDSGNDTRNLVDLLKLIQNVVLGKRDVGKYATWMDKLTLTGETTGPGTNLLCQFLGLVEYIIPLQDPFGGRYVSGFEHIASPPERVLTRQAVRRVMKAAPPPLFDATMDVKSDDRGSTLHAHLVLPKKNIFDGPCVQFSWNSVSLAVLPMFVPIQADLVSDPPGEVFFEAMRFTLSPGSMHLRLNSSIPALSRRLFSGSLQAQLEVGALGMPLMAPYRSGAATFWAPHLDEGDVFLSWYVLVRRLIQPQADQPLHALLQASYGAGANWTSPPLHLHIEAMTAVYHAHSVQMNASSGLGALFSTDQLEWVGWQTSELQFVYPLARMIRLGLQDQDTASGGTMLGACFLLRATLPLLNFHVAIVKGAEAWRDEAGPPMPMSPLPHNLLLPNARPGYTRRSTDQAKQLIPEEPPQRVVRILVPSMSLECIYAADSSLMLNVTEIVSESSNLRIKQSGGGVIPFHVYVESAYHLMDFLQDFLAPLHRQQIGFSVGVPVGPLPEPHRKRAPWMIAMPPSYVHWSRWLGILAGAVANPFRQAKLPQLGSSDMLNRIVASVPAALMTDDPLCLDVSLSEPDDQNLYIDVRLAFPRLFSAPTPFHRVRRAPDPMADPAKDSLMTYPMAFKWKLINFMLSSPTMPNFLAVAIHPGEVRFRKPDAEPRDLEYLGRAGASFAPSSDLSMRITAHAPFVETAGQSTSSFFAHLLANLTAVGETCQRCHQTLPAWAREALTGLRAHFVGDELELMSIELAPDFVVSVMRVIRTLASAPATDGSDVLVDDFEQCDDNDSDFIKPVIAKEDPDDAEPYPSRNPPYEVCIKDIVREHADQVYPFPCLLPKLCPPLPPRITGEALRLRFKVEISRALPRFMDSMAGTLVKMISKMDVPAYPRTLQFTLHPPRSHVGLDLYVAGISTFAIGVGLPGTIQRTRSLHYALTQTAFDAEYGSRLDDDARDLPLPPDPDPVVLHLRLIMRQNYRGFMHFLAPLTLYADFPRRPMTWAAPVSAEPFFEAEKVGFPALAMSFSALKQPLYGYSEEDSYYSGEIVKTTRIFDDFVAALMSFMLRPPRTTDKDVLPRKTAAKKGDPVASKDGDNSDGMKVVDTDYYLLKLRSMINLDFGLKHVRIQLAQAPNATVIYAGVPFARIVMDTDVIDLGESRNTVPLCIELDTRREPQIVYDFMSRHFMALDLNLTVRSFIDPEIGAELTMHLLASANQEKGMVDFFGPIWNQTFTEMRRELHIPLPTIPYSFTNQNDFALRFYSFYLGIGFNFPYLDFFTRKTPDKGHANILGIHAENPCCTDEHGVQLAEWYQCVHCVRTTAFKPEAAVLQKPLIELPPRNQVNTTMLLSFYPSLGKAAAAETASYYLDDKRGLCMDVTGHMTMSLARTLSGHAKPFLIEMKFELPPREIPAGTDPCQKSYRCLPQLEWLDVIPPKVAAFDTDVLLLQDPIDARRSFTIQLDIKITDDMYLGGFTLAFAPSAAQILSLYRAGNLPVGDPNADDFSPSFVWRWNDEPLIGQIGGLITTTSVELLYNGRQLDLEQPGHLVDTPSLSSLSAPGFGYPMDDILAIRLAYDAYAHTIKLAIFRVSQTGDSYAASASKLALKSTLHGIDLAFSSHPSSHAIQLGLLKDLAHNDIRLKMFGYSVVHWPHALIYVPTRGKYARPLLIHRRAVFFLHLRDSCDNPIAYPHLAMQWTVKLMHHSGLVEYDATILPDAAEEGWVRAGFLPLQVRIHMAGLYDVKACYTSSHSNAKSCGNPGTLYFGLF